MHESTHPHVLLVEDEFLIAEALQLHLESLGAHVVGPVARVADALALLERAPHIDCALLDVRLHGEAAFPVADALAARGVRFAFLSAYDRSALPEAYRGATYFSKLEDPLVYYRWACGDEPR